MLICRCEEITEEEVLRAIQDGARSVNEVKRRTRAGMGLCQGKTCSHLVMQILARETGLPPAELPPGTARPPVRPLKLSALAEEEE
ncbi:MAG: (2Fe-2S)-binding protein [Chloroflexi bacterium]|nr:(2Fe-2S)-binding protein [Chloroflexota bacterium]